MAHIEQTRAVVEEDETYDGKIIPTERAELDRPVRVRTNAVVQGSVYGETVETDAEASIAGSVMASESVDLSGCRVRGEVGTPGKVVGADSRVDGTVTGKRVRLTDCVVRGNVVGTEVVLENCVVLGIATADRKLVVEDSLCYTFQSQGDTRLENATLVLPQAVANGELTLDTPVAIAGLGQLETAEGENDSRLPEMTEEDRYEQGENTYLTLAPRILNLEAITDRLAELEDGVMQTVDDTSGTDGAEMTVTDVLEMLNVDYDATDATA